MADGEKSTILNPNEAAIVTEGAGGMSLLIPAAYYENVEGNTTVLPMNIKLLVAYYMRLQIDPEFVQEMIEFVDDALAAEGDDEVDIDIEGSSIH